MAVTSELQNPAALTPGKKPGTDWMGGWVGPVAGMGSGEENAFYF
jgi:hypothetical protein